MSIKVHVEHGWFMTASTRDEAFSGLVDMYADNQTDGDYDEAEALVAEDYSLGIISTYGNGGDHSVH